MSAADCQKKQVQHHPMRNSIFPGVPPFINYVPQAGYLPGLDPGAQYWDDDSGAQKWDQEQLWRFTVAMQRWIEDCSASDQHTAENAFSEKIDPTFVGSVGSSRMNRKKRASRILSLEIKPPFSQRPDDNTTFKHWHPGVKTCQVPRLWQLSHKDSLGATYAKYASKFPDEYNFHPQTFTLPKDRPQLIKQMKLHQEVKSQAFWYDEVCDNRQFWIVKPPNLNNGTGIHVIPNNIDSIPEYPTCVQSYIKGPLLIDGYKFDIRLYVLVTSFDPLRIYLYEDGLVRIATEEYSEDEDKVTDCCVHVTNFAVNVKNESNKFVYNETPSECFGNKWRLQCLWKYFRQMEYTDDQVSQLWSDMEDLVVKTMLLNLKEVREEFNAMSKSMYNTYKLLGFDVLVQGEDRLKPYLIEVNARPQLKDDIVDKAVNRPMLAEMVRIVGYHIPSSCDKHHHFLKKKFSLTDRMSTSTVTTKHQLQPNGKVTVMKEKVDTKLSGFQPLTYEPRMYSRSCIEEDDVKRDRFSDKEVSRDSYLDSILQDMSPADVRLLVKAEEELNQCKGFTRLFPTATSHKYFKFFDGGVLPYNDKLLDAFEHHYSGQKRMDGINRIKKMTQQGFHL